MQGHLSTPTILLFFLLRLFSPFSWIITINIETSYHFSLFIIVSETTLPTLLPSSSALLLCFPFQQNCLKDLSVLPAPNSSSLLLDFASAQDLANHFIETPLLRVHSDIKLLHLPVTSQSFPYLNDQQYFI